MLLFIGQANRELEEGIAGRIGVCQETVSRWLSGKSFPEPEHLARIVATFHQACEDVRAAFPVPAHFHYLCSFAPTYLDDRAEEAERALKESVVNVLDTDTPPPGSIQIDFHIRASKLTNGARAHCFVDSRESPKVFVVLVSNELSIHDQYIVAFEEAYAHVMNRLIDRTKVTVHPAPIIK